MERVSARQWIVPTSFFANSFRNPLGNSLISPENDGDGFYVAFGFDEPNPDIGGSHHLGVDWNGEGGGNTDLGEPVYAIGNGTVVAIVSDQGSATTGFGNYIVLRHDLPEPTLINGQLVTQIHSLYAHLDTASTFSVGQQVGIGTRIGTLGMSGYADVAHLHLEITIGSVLPTDDDGYNPTGAPAAWVDPVAFVRTFMPNDPPQVSTTPENGLRAFLNDFVALDASDLQSDIRSDLSILTGIEVRLSNKLPGFLSSSYNILDIISNIELGARIGEEYSALSQSSKQLLTSALEVAPSAAGQFQDRLDEIDTKLRADITAINPDFWSNVWEGKGRLAQFYYGAALSTLSAAVGTASDFSSSIKAVVSGALASVQVAQTAWYSANALISGVPGNDLPSRVLDATSGLIQSCIGLSTTALGGGTISTSDRAAATAQVSKFVSALGELFDLPANLRDARDLPAVVAAIQAIASGNQAFFDTRLSLLDGIISSRPHFPFASAVDFVGTALDLIGAVAAGFEWDAIRQADSKVETASAHEVLEASAWLKAGEISDSISGIIGDLVGLVPATPQGTALVASLKNALDLWLDLKLSADIWTIDQRADYFSNVAQILDGSFDSVKAEYQHLLDALGSEWGKTMRVAIIAPTGGGDVWASNYDDNVVGSANNDRLFANAGFDDVRAGGGNDTVFAGEDKDIVYGGAGSDYLKGELGNDSIYGETESDELFGDEGKDELYGGLANDILRVRTRSRFIART